MGHASSTNRRMIAMPLDRVMKGKLRSLMTAKEPLAGVRVSRDC
jgi:hypothetical protein